MNKIHISNTTIPKLHTRFRNIPQWKDTFDKINYHEYDIYGSFTANGVLNWTIPANTSIQPKQLMMINQRYIPTTTNTIVVSGGFIEGTNMIHNGFGIYFNDNNYILCHSNATVGKLLVVINGVLVFYSGNNTVSGSMKIAYDRSTNIIRYYRYQSGWNLLVTTTQVMPNVNAKLFVGTIKSNGSNTSNLTRSLSQVYFTPFDYSDEIPTFNNGNRYEFMSKYIPSFKHIYGYLYNKYVVNESVAHGGFINEFIVPNTSDYINLFNLIGGQVQGGKLKSTIVITDGEPYWNTPNDGAIDLFGFSILATGKRRYIEENNPTYFGLHETTILHCTELNSYDGIEIYDYTVEVDIGGYNYTDGCAIRLIRALNEFELLLDDGILLSDVSDYNGRTYNVIKIGNYGWTKQNLVCKHYADGTPIPEVTDDTEWRNLTTGARCSYNNDESNAFIIE